MHFFFRFGMLSKEECKKATTKWKDIIKKWQRENANVEEINKIINPSAVFNFTVKDCNWLKDNIKHRNSNFHAYAGVHDHKFILIMVPLHEDGTEKDNLNKFAKVRSAIQKIETSNLRTQIFFSYFFKFK